jgi:hypothetical protein
MRIRIISSRKEIASLKPNEKTVHMAFRASNVDYLNLLQQVPRLQMIQAPPSYMKTMSKAVEVFLEMQGVKLIEGDVWGHRRDLDEYFTIENATIEEIHTLVDSGASMDDVAEKVQRKAKISSDLIKFIASTNSTA